jgi:translation initiation factor 3 subunit C
MSSKFFNKDSSGSESEDEKPALPVPSAFAKAPAASSGGAAKPKVSQPEEDQKPKSKKDAAVSQIQEQEKCVRNKLKNQDWDAVSSEFKLLLQLVEKHKTQMDRPPATYIRLLYDLDTKVRVAASDKQALKTMSKKNASGLQVLKKQVKTGADNHKDLFDEYSQNPAKSESEGSSDSDDSEESEEESDEESESSEDDSESSSGSGSGSDEEDSEQDEAPKEAAPTSKQAKAAAFLVDKSASFLVDNDKKAAKPKDKAKKANKAVKVSSDFVDPTPSRKDPFSDEMVEEMFKQIVANRGRKTVELKRQMEDLRDMLSFTKHPSVSAKILVHMISLEFDAAHMQFMPTDTWRAVLGYVSNLLDVVERNPQELGADSDVAISAATDALLDEDSFDMIDGASISDTVPSAVYVANSSLLSTSLIVEFLDRLGDELHKCLQQLSPAAQQLQNEPMLLPEFTDRLPDEQKLVKTLLRVYKFAESRNKFKALARCAIRLISSFYYKHTDSLKAAADSQHAAAEQAKKDLASAGKSAAEQKAANEKASSLARSAEDARENLKVQELFPRWVRMVYLHGDDRLKSHACLAHIFYLANHDKFFEARDMMLASHMQDQLTHSGSNAGMHTMVMHNRATAMLGLAAFKQGLIKEAHACLQDLFSQGHQRDLLAQDVVRRMADKTDEDQRLSRRRFVP